MMSMHYPKLIRREKFCLQFLALAVLFAGCSGDAVAAPAGMALIPAGSFTIGDPLDGESDAVLANVYVSAFYMDTNLVSFGQWQAVYNYALAAGYNFDLND